MPVWLLHCSQGVCWCVGWIRLIYIAWDDIVIVNPTPAMMTQAFFELCCVLLSSVVLCKAEQK